MDKFLVYAITEGRMIKRSFANEADVKFLLQEENVQVIRSSTNQLAITVGDIVLWQDIEDVPLIDVK